MNRVPRAHALTFRDTAVGMKYSFKRLISQADVEAFARLSGDYNPLHIDKSFAEGTPFKGAVVHGMLAASLISALIGMRLPGRYGVMVHQDIKYISPIRPGQTVKVFGEVVNKIDSVRVLMIRALIAGKDDKVLVEGTAKVKMLR